MQTSFNITNIIQISKKIISQPHNKHYTQLYYQILPYLSDYTNLPIILQHITYNKQFMITALNILILQIKKGTYIPQLNKLYQLKNSSQQEKQKQATNQQIQQYKVNVYWYIIQFIYKIVSQNILESYLINSCKDLMAQCLKCTIDGSDDIKHLEQFFKIFFKGFELNNQFTKLSRQPIVFIEPVMKIFSQNFTFSIEVLISFLDEIVINTNFKTYYDYRRFIYLFKTGYLSHILQLTLYYLRSFFKEMANNNSNNLDNMLLKYLAITLKLFQCIVSYPFALNIHQFQYEPDYHNQSTNQIFFPSYFRHITTDLKLMQNLYEFYLLIISINQKSKQSNEISLCLLRILSRLTSANNYYFETQAERVSFRKQVVIMLIKIMVSSNRFEQQYINHIVDILNKILTSYSQREYEEYFSQFIQNLLMFICKIVEVSSIQLELRQNNPTTRVFELLKNIHSQINPEKIMRNLIYQTYTIEQESPSSYPVHSFFDWAQLILEKYMTRLSNQYLISKMMSYKFRNYKKQVNGFRQLFKGIPFIFGLNIEKNMKFLNSLQFLNMSLFSQNIWLYFCTVIINQHKIYSPEDNQLILKLFMLVKNRPPSVCNMNFIQSLVTHLLNQLNDGVSNNDLWVKITGNNNEINNENNLNELIYTIIQQCIKYLCIENEDIIQYSLDILKLIYGKIKKMKEHNEVQKLNQNKKILFYEQFRNFLNNLQNTIFEMPPFYNKRIKLYEMVSIIWVQENQIRFSYQIYQQIRKALIVTSSLQNTIKYLYDITGLITPLQSYHNYKTILELVLEDLPILINTFFNPNNIIKNLSQNQILKAFMKMAESLLKDTSKRLWYETHTDITLKIHDLLNSVLRTCAQFPYSKRLLLIYTRFIGLNPLSNILPIPRRQNCKKQTECQVYFHQLLTNSFENIKRYQNIEQLYPYIKYNIDFMYSWWQEAIARKLNIQINNFGEVVQAKLWKSKRQHQQMARIVFMAGKYNIKYQLFPRLLENFTNEQIFIKNFIEYTK